MTTRYDFHMDDESSKTIDALMSYLGTRHRSAALIFALSLVQDVLFDQGHYDKVEVIRRPTPDGLGVLPPKAKFHRDGMYEPELY